MTSTVWWRSNRRATLAGAMLLLGLAGGCGGGDSDRAGRGLGSGVWPGAGVSSSVLAATPEAVEALRQAGVETLFVEAGAVSPDGVLVRAALAAAAPELAVVLVVRIPWAQIEELSRRAASRLADDVVLLAVEWEGAGGTVRGLHLRPVGDPDDRVAIAAGLRHLARELPRRYPFSLHLDARLLDDPAPLDEWAAGVDLVVGEIYGQDARDGDRPSSWDLDAALERARRVDSLARPFLAGVAIGGRVIDPVGGAVVAAGLPGGALSSEAARTEGVFVFEGFHRQLFDLVPRRPLRGTGPDGEETTLAPGAPFRLARPTARHLAILLERLRGAGLERLENVVWTEARPPGDAAAVPLDRLPAVVAGAAGSDLRVVLERRGGGDGLQVAVVNEGDPTAWAQRDHNYVEVVLDGAVFGAIELGDFERLELDRRDGGGSRQTMATLRSADRLRLYFFQLEPGAKMASGAIRVRPRSADWSAGVSAEALEPTGEISVASAARPGQSPEP
jgi:hypothetical protein